MTDEKLKYAIELQKEIKELKAHYRIVSGKEVGKETPEDLYDIGEGLKKPDMEITTAYTNTKIPLMVQLLPIPLTALVNAYLNNVGIQIKNLETQYNNL
jgi:hypothetical protein